jgi:hypothetical protein
MKLDPARISFAPTSPGDLKGAGGHVTDLVARFARQHHTEVAGSTGSDRLAGLWGALTAAGIPAPGLAFARWASAASAAGVLTPILINSPDVGSLLERLRRFHPLFGPDRIMIVSDQDTTSLWLETPDAKPAHHDSVDACFAMLCGLTRELTTDAITARHVTLRRSLPADPARYREMLGEVRFGADRDLCTFDAHALRAPIVAADPVVLSLLEPYAERRSPT